MQSKGGRWSTLCVFFSLSGLRMRDISVASLAAAVRSDREIVRIRSDICLLSPDMTERLLAGGCDPRRAVIRVLDPPSRPRSALAANVTESIGHSPDFRRILAVVDCRRGDRDIPGLQLTALRRRGSIRSC